ncbi:MAG: hypothetical protein FH761_13880 [Firmicutes bacterium]|nr:hypothetical protein [Bacillota bacterium]
MVNSKSNLIYIGLIVLLIIILGYNLVNNYENKEKIIDYDKRITLLQQANDRLEEIIQTSETREQNEEEVRYSKTESLLEINTREIKSQPLDYDRLENYVLLGEYTTGAQENLNNLVIELYSQVEVYNGEYLWNDGQKWMLVARDNEDIYILFDEYVQLGKIDVYLYKIYDDSTTSYISTIQNSNSGLIIKDYSFDKEKDCFIEEKVFEKGNDGKTDKWPICNY